MPAKSDVLTATPRPAPVAQTTLRSLWRARAALAETLALVPREVTAPPGIHPTDWEQVLSMIGAEVADAVAAGGVPATLNDRGALVARVCDAMRARVRAKYSPDSPGADRWLAVDRSLSAGTGYLPIGEIGLAVRASLGGHQLRETLQHALRALDEAQR